jgi:CHAT domain/SIR2-like domain
MNYAELEIRLSRVRKAGRYQVALGFKTTDDAERLPVGGATALNLEALDELVDTAGNAYGLALAEGLFHSADVRKRYGEFKAAVEGADEFMRVKLFVDRSAPDLHPLRWELLTDPVTGQPFATSERILFSRFGWSSDWRRVQVRAKSELTALVAVSNPSNLERDFRLGRVDVEGEVARACEHLRGIRVVVAGQDASDPLSLDRLVDGLRGGVDILYLVCHGGLRLGEGPLLYLQGEDGNVEVAGGDEFAQRIGELVDPPRLVVLASCESAGSEQMSTQSAIVAGQLVPLAPALAEAGVQAVVAMQGKISMQTVKKAMPAFFAELLKDGQIDRAFAVARGKVRQRPDGWMPALFMRLKGGRIWYEPGFGDGESDFGKWRAIVGAVRRGEFTPIVGPGLGESVYGPLQEASRQLAETTGFPLAEYQRSELQQVSQFVQYNQDVATAREAFKAVLRDQILRRHDSLSEDEKALNLPRLLTLVGEKNRGEDSDSPGDPYRLLAQLDANLFVTANPDNLLEEALLAEGKKPETAVFSWREKKKQVLGFRSWEPKKPIDKLGEPKTEPDALHPLVFHIFGHFRYDDSLVLTEDDYFDYFVSLSRYKPWSRTVIGAQTLGTSLLYLGFGLTDWSFRVLYRLIMGQEGNAQLMSLTHVAVQVDPEEDTLINPRAARKYLEAYLGSSGLAERAAATIFWGSAGEFLTELNNKLATIEEATHVGASVDTGDW